MERADESRPNRLNSIWVQLGAAILSVTLGVIGSIVSSSEKVLLDYTGLFYIFMFAGVAFIVISLLASVLHDLRTESIMRSRADSISDKIPRLVVFTSRTDTVTVFPNGDGLFEYSHQVEYNGGSDDGLTELHFPVLFDRSSPSSPPDQDVDLQSIKVNGKPIAHQDLYEPKESRFPIPLENPNQVKEYGVIKVPLNLTAKERHALVEIVIGFRGVFISPTNDSSVIIDIPYLTDLLKVRIKHYDLNGKLGRSAHGTGVITAVAEMMYLTDVLEGRREAQNVSHDNGVIEWETRKAKVGYRYFLGFGLNGA